MRAVVMAGGDGLRWGNHRGVPKHLVDIDGAPLLERTCNQLAERGCEVVVLGPDEDTRYKVDGCKLSHPAFTACDTDKLMSSLAWLHASEPTVIVYGDCYLTDLAVDTLCFPQLSFVFVGREGASSFTGCEWGELFGVHIAPEGHGILAAAVVQVRDLLLSGEIHRGGGWEVYRRTQGIELDVHEIRGDFVEVDDWSDDFDFPEDYERWLSLRGVAA